MMHMLSYVPLDVRATNATVFDVDQDFIRFGPWHRNLPVFKRCRYFQRMSIETRSAVT